MKKYRLHLCASVLCIAALSILAVLVYRRGICRITIPTVSQHDAGYPRGCEGVSLYMAMKGKGYLEGVSLDAFMETMPASESDPEYGYVGDPTAGADAPANQGKRTTINPSPLAQWGSGYGTVVSLEGADVSELKKELRNGNPVVVYVTGSWAEPVWGSWDWGDAVTNNHAVCLTGYNAWTGEYLINDCGSHTGEYWIEKEVFETAYNARHYAVVVR